MKPRGVSEYSESAHDDTVAPQVSPMDSDSKGTIGHRDHRRNDACTTREQELELEQSERVRKRKENLPSSRDEEREQGCRAREVSGCRGVVH